jgi:PIN domain nuclease of toxin-antitoxin system
MKSHDIAAAAFKTQCLKLLDEVAATGRPLTITKRGRPGELRGDPADRIIAATARHLGARLVTADEKLLAHGAAGFIHTLSAVET